VRVALLCGGLGEARLAPFLAAESPGGADLLLADLGVSSMQIDDPARGFTFKDDGPLDMRMNPARGQSASALLSTLDQGGLAGLLAELRTEGAAVRHAVLGVGLNCGTARGEFPDELRQTATSLALERGETVARLLVFARLLESLDEWLALHDLEGFAPVRERFESVRFPLVALSITDDELMTERGTHVLVDCYANAPRRVERIAPADVQARRIGHFGFFRDQFQASLWQRTATLLQGFEQPQETAA